MVRQALLSYIYLVLSKLDFKFRAKRILVADRYSALAGAQVR